MAELTLKIDGMHCGGCVNRVNLALRKIEGVTVESVEVGAAKVAYNPEASTPAEIAEAVNRIGFTAAVKE